VLAIGALAALLLSKGWYHYLAPHAEVAMATRAAGSGQPFQISSLALEEMPDVGPRSDSKAWIALQAQLAELKRANETEASTRMGVARHYACRFIATMMPF